MRNYQYNDLTIKQFNNKKGVSLIIVIFAMMLFSVLGWTLAVMQSTDFEANLRNLDSERALGLGEAGANWALNQLSQDSGWRTDPTNPDDDCNDSDDWIIHSLNFGQYRVCCRNPDIGAGEQGDAVIESEGYIPTYTTNYRAMRDVKLEVELGSFDKVLQAHNLFNWSPMHDGSRINGDIQAAFYDRNGNCNPADGTGCNELGIDYDPLPTPVLPADGSGDDRTVAAEPYPAIKMTIAEYGDESYEYMAGLRVWPQNWVANQAAITAITPRPGNLVDVEVDQAIFGNPASQWNNQILRNVSPGRSWIDTDWRIISGRIDNRTVRVTDDSLNWVVNDTIRIVERFAEDHTGEDLWYIKGDVLFDVRDVSLGGGGDIVFKETSVVAEGDIVIRGRNQLKFVDKKPFNYPNIATQNGNVISTEEPTGDTEAKKRRKRTFDSLIYTQNGNIDFNYLDGTALIGNNVDLDGLILLKYSSFLENLTGFIWGLSEIKWQEQ